MSRFKETTTFFYKNIMESFWEMGKTIPTVNCKMFISLNLDSPIEIASKISLQKLLNIRFSSVSGSQDSPVVLSVLEDVKRIKVNNNKKEPLTNLTVTQQPSLYPHLSDIETDTSHTQDEYSDCGGSRCGHYTLECIFFFLCIWIFQMLFGGQHQLKIGALWRHSVSFGCRETRQVGNGCRAIFLTSEHTRAAVGNLLKKYQTCSYFIGLY